MMLEFVDSLSRAEERVRGTGGIDSDSDNDSDSEYGKYNYHHYFHTRCQISER